MSLAGVSDVVTDWRARMVTRNGFRLFGATQEHKKTMRDAGLDVTGTLDDLLGQLDVVVDCSPKRIATKNVDAYRRRESSSSCRAAKSTTQQATRSWPRRTTQVPWGARPPASCRATKPLSSGP